MERKKPFLLPHLQTHFLPSRMIWENNVNAGAHPGKNFKEGTRDKGLSNYGPRTEKKLIGGFGNLWTVVEQAWKTVRGKDADNQPTAPGQS